MCGKKSRSVQYGAFPGFNPSPGEVSVFPGLGSPVNGCSYTDFRGVVLIDTDW